MDGRMDVCMNSSRTRKNHSQLKSSINPHPRPENLTLQPETNLDLMPKTPTTSLTLFACETLPHLGINIFLVHKLPKGILPPLIKYFCTYLFS